MSIPEEIIECINNNLKCPLCKVGNIEIKPTIVYYEVVCDNCGKKLVIDYKKDPFEIIRIREASQDLHIL